MNKNNDLAKEPRQKVFLFSFVYIIFIVIFTYLNVLNEKQALYHQLDKQLEDAAMVTDLLLPPGLHHKAMKKSDITETHNNDNILSLSAFTDQRDIIYIYTLVLQEGKILFTSSSATPEERESGEQLSFYFDEYDDVDPRVFGIFKSEQKTFLEYTDQWGTFRSVFVPLYAPDGTLYLTAADLSISHIQAILKELIVNSIIIAFLFLLFAFPIYYTATRKLKHDANRLNTEVQRQALVINDNQERLLQNQRVLLELAKENFIDQATALSKIISIAAKQLEVARVSIWLFNSDQTAIISQVQYLQGEISTDNTTIGANDHPHYFEKISRDGFISADDIHTHPDTIEFLEGYALPLGINSMLDTPIYSQGNVIGVTCFEHIGPKRHWSREDEDFARSISDLSSQVIINEKRKNAEKLLKVRAHYDELTKLPNRVLFADRFSRAIAHSKRNKTLLSICFLDLDNFKPVNDTYGHDIGDQLLIEVAKRLKDVIREHDTVSRQGGDEFALLLNNIESKTECGKILNRINAILNQPYSIDGAVLKISVSIGSTLYPSDDADLDTLLRHADQAMYQAKLAGKNQPIFFNPENDQEIAFKQKQLQEIEHALANDEFRLYYQPKVNMRTGDIFGAEALIRWFHPTKGMIAPLDFLPLIEGDNLEIQLGNWVINEALEQMAKWHQQDIDLEISINISSYHLQTQYFFDQLKDALDNHPTIKPELLQIEILESSVLSDLETVSDIIENCQNILGISIALDDFGTGYSSLTHIRDLSADVIKIDQAFVRDLLVDPNDYSIIESIIALSRAFNHKVIAEGVETDEHGLMLLMMGCDEAQGYGISRPLPAKALPVWLTDYKPNQKWLNYQQHNLSAKQKKRLLIELTTKHWYKNALFLIEAERQESKLAICHLGMWFNRLQSEQVFSKDRLKVLKVQHDLMLTLANALFLRKNTVDLTIEQIDDFKAAYRDLKTIIRAEDTYDFVSFRDRWISAK
jgi:diguanylate cyclase (GGDEF)-like protein